MTFVRPEPLMFARSMAFSLDSLLFNKERPDRDEFYNPLKRPTLCGMVIPDFQRGLVWSEAQQVKLIHSVWMGIPIGTYSVNFSTDRLPPRLTNILIDGQQRINSLRAYWDDEIAYQGYLWSQLSELDRRYFVRGSFPQMRTESKDIGEVLRYYEVMNFGGTDHTQDDADVLAEAVRAAHRRGEV